MPCGSDDGTLRLWDVQRGEPLRVLAGYPAILYDLDWNPDGTRLYSLHEPSASVHALAWSPDGRVVGMGPREDPRHRYRHVN